jgi:RNA polymerase sigma-70 factor, ECF subfamily
MVVARIARFECMAEARESAKPQTDASTGALTRRLLKADEEAYREFHDLYSHRLFGYLFVLCRGNEEQAREILQQTLIKVARYIRVFDDEEIFWKWQTALARSCWIDETRKRNRYLAALERLWKRNSHQDLAHDAALDELAERAIEFVSEEDRVILKQKYFDGLSVREIAEACGATEKAVESRLTRARARMKEMISPRRQA